MKRRSDEATGAVLAVRARDDRVDLSGTGDAGTLRKAMEGQVLGTERADGDGTEDVLQDSGNTFMSSFR